jgi:hypothetical protein
VPVTVKRMVFSDASRDEGSQISVVRD